MPDRPILFSGPMVRALLEGRKSQTRRVIKRARVFGTPDRPAFTLCGDELTRALQGASRWRHYGDDGWYWEADAFPWQAPATRTGWLAHLGYAPGDRLWVKETWRAGVSWDDVKPSNIPAGVPIDYVATPRSNGPAGKSRVSIFMPRWASRLTLTVTDVRVERLQGISEVDATAEGIERVDRPPFVEPGPPTFQVPGFSGSTTATLAFRYLWSSINTAPGKRWEDNPFVVALSFAVERRNIDGRAR